MLSIDIVASCFCKIDWQCVICSCTVPEGKLVEIEFRRVVLFQCYMTHLWIGTREGDRVEVDFEVCIDNSVTGGHKYRVALRADGFTGSVVPAHEMVTLRRNGGDGYRRGGIVVLYLYVALCPDGAVDASVDFVWFVFKNCC